MKIVNLSFILNLVFLFQGFLFFSQNEIDKINILTAGNFDFGEKVKLNYLGHINFYSPNINGKRFGINCGVMKINYNDTNQLLESYSKDNILLNPLKNPAVGDKYISQFNRYKFSLKNVNWSNYCQLILLLNKFDAQSKFYLNLHGELAINRVNIDYEFNTLYQDTMIFDSTNVSNVYRANVNTNGSQQKSFYNWYLGTGITGDIFICEKGRLFTQLNAGVTKGIPYFPSILNYNSLVQDNPERKYSIFYMYRFYYLHTISDAAKGVFGADIRGMGKVDPQYALYLGLTIDVAKFFEALGGK